MTDRIIVKMKPGRFIPNPKSKLNEARECDYCGHVKVVYNSGFGNIICYSCFDPIYQRMNTRG